MGIPPTNVTYTVQVPDHCIPVIRETSLLFPIFPLRDRPFSLPPLPLSPSLSVDVIAVQGSGDAIAV